jgi:formiminotetrahydrofolate cyclodeaminase
MSQQSKRIVQPTLDAYLAALASDAPVPGGGSAACLTGAAGAALVAMVARICVQNPAYARWRDEAAQIAGRADELRTALLEARRRDEAAFARVVETQALPKASQAERDARRDRLNAALERAAAEPLRGARLSFDALMLALRALEIPNRNLAGDVGCAAELAGAALRACAYNVRANHRFMRDKEKAAVQERQLSNYETEARTVLDTIRSVVAERLRVQAG